MRHKQTSIQPSRSCSDPEEPDRETHLTRCTNSGMRCFSNAALLAKTVEMLDKIPMEDRDTKGDLYEYLLANIASAGQNGQFRTPRHIIQLMVEMVEPTPDDVICDPAAGTWWLSGCCRRIFTPAIHPGLFRNEKQRKHFHTRTFHGYDFDPTMLRIGSMNMTLHGVENPDVSYRDSLAQEHTDDAGTYSLVLANPPSAGSLDYEATAKDLQQIVKTKKTELLFLALFLRLLKTGGRAAVIVPDGVLFGSSKAHQELRRMLVEDHKLDAAVKTAIGGSPALCGRVDGHSCCSPRLVSAAQEGRSARAARRRRRRGASPPRR